MADLTRLRTRLLVGALSLVAVSCGPGDDASSQDIPVHTVAETTLLSSAPTETEPDANDGAVPASLAAESTTSSTLPTDDDAVERPEHDMALSVSSSQSDGDAVSVVAEIRSVDGTPLASPYLFIVPGDGVDLINDSDSCATRSDGVECSMSPQTEDDTVSQKVDIVVTFRIAPDAANPTATLTVGSSDRLIGPDADPSNNVVTVVFIESGATGEPPADVVEAQPDTSSAFDFEIEVHTDGCGVFRTGQIGDDLTWVVTDEDGFQVLGRNAAGETQYRYYRPGTYTVHLETWGGDYYVPVSNEVTITC